MVYVNVLCWVEFGAINEISLDRHYLCVAIGSDNHEAMPISCILIEQAQEQFIVYIHGIALIPGSSPLDWNK